MSQPALTSDEMTATQWLAQFDQQEKDHRKSVEDRRLCQYADMDRFPVEHFTEQPNDLLYSLKRLHDFYGERLSIFYELMSNIQLTAEEYEVTDSAIQKWLERLRLHCLEWEITPEMFNRMMLFATK